MDEPSVWRVLWVIVKHGWSIPAAVGLVAYMSLRYTGWLSGFLAGGVVASIVAAVVAARERRKRGYEDVIIEYTGDDPRLIGERCRVGDFLAGYVRDPGWYGDPDDWHVDAHSLVRKIVEEHKKDV